MMKLYEAGVEKRPPGVVLANVVRQTGGAYETTTSLTEKFRHYIREVAELTSDDELLRIAELPEVPVSLEVRRQLDPQTRVVMFCRLNVSPAETPRWRRILPAGRLGTNHSHLTPEEDHARLEMRILRAGNCA